MLTIIWEKFICYWLDILKIKAFFTAIKIFWLDILIIWDNVNRHWFWFDSVKTQDKEYSYCIWDNINRDGFRCDLNFLYLITGSWIETLYTWFWLDRLRTWDWLCLGWRKNTTVEKTCSVRKSQIFRGWATFIPIPIKKDDKTHCPKTRIKSFSQHVYDTCNAL